jgi:hypothetical protein
MRWLMLTVVALVASLSSTSGSAAPGGPSDFVAGAGKNFPLRFVVSARTDADGGDPRGMLRFTLAGVGSFTVQVTCVLIEGNTAVVGGTLNTPSAGNPTAAIGLIDNGSGDESAGITFFGGDPPARCENFSLLPEFRSPLTHGNVVIHDA